MRKFFAFGILALLVFAACKNDKKGGYSAEITNATTLAGFWVPADFCARAAKEGSVLKVMNNYTRPYAYALGFDSAIPDSVTCFNGVEKWRMPVIFRKDTIEIPKADGKLSIFLVYDPETNKDLTMFDGTSGKTAINRFTLSKSQAMDGYTAFLLELNNLMMRGNFKSTSKGANEVRFEPGGRLRGIDGYDKYELCTGGDCVVMKDMDVITFSNSQKPDSETMFGFKFLGKRDTLQIYNLINQNPAEKGNYALGTIAHNLVNVRIASPKTAPKPAPKPGTPPPSK